MRQVLGPGTLGRPRGIGWRGGGRGEKKKQHSTFIKLRSWYLVPSLHGKKMGKQCDTVTDYFFGFQNHCRW